MTVREHVFLVKEFTEFVTRNERNQIYIVKGCKVAPQDPLSPRPPSAKLLEFATAENC